MPLSIHLIYMNSDTRLQILGIMFFTISDHSYARSRSVPSPIDSFVPKMSGISTSSNITEGSGFAVLLPVGPSLEIYTTSPYT